MSKQHGLLRVCVVQNVPKSVTAKRMHLPGLWLVFVLYVFWHGLVVTDLSLSCRCPQLDLSRSCGFLNLDLSLLSFWCCDLDLSWLGLVSVLWVIWCGLVLKDFSQSFWCPQLDMCWSCGCFNLEFSWLRLPSLSRLGFNLDSSLTWTCLCLVSYLALTCH